MRFCVGQIIAHARYGYPGVITGWDTSCQAVASWIAQMGVDQLPSVPRAACCLRPCVGFLGCRRVPAA